MNVKTMVIERGELRSREVLRFPVLSWMTKVPFSLRFSDVKLLEKVKKLDLSSKVAVVVREGADLVRPD